MNTQNAARIANQIGQIVEIEEPIFEGCLVRSFMRVRVMVNVYKPLLKGCWIPRRDLPKTWVVFRHEILQGLCFNCGIIGHEQNGCKRERAMVVVNKEVSRYSGQLGIPAARPISVIAKERERWKTKPKYPAAGERGLGGHKGEANISGYTTQQQWEEEFFTTECESGKKEQEKQKMVVPQIRSEEVSPG